MLVPLLCAVTGILGNSINMSQFVALVQIPTFPSQFLKMFLGQCALKRARLFQVLKRRTRESY